MTTQIKYVKTRRMISFKPIWIWVVLSISAPVFGASFKPPQNALPQATLAGLKAKCEPELTASHKKPRKLHIVIFGVGDVVKKYYSPALKSLKEQYSKDVDLSVTFIDAKSYWKDDPKLAEKMTGIISEVEGWGAKVIDISDEAVGKPAYDALIYDVAVIATPDFLHVDKARECLKRACPPRVIFVEKPLDRDLVKAQEFLFELGNRDNRVFTLDHYRARLLPKKAQLEAINHYLGGGIKNFSYYFLEDHSAADPKHTALVQRDGAIEREQRVKALDSGVIMDGLPHMFPLLEYFGFINSVRITKIKAAQYKGVDGDPEKRTEIKNETYAEVHFVFSRKHSIYGDPVLTDGFVEGVAHVGKGIRGVKALGPEYDHNAKMLEVVGVNGRKIRFDLRSESTNGTHSNAYLLEDDGSIALQFPLYAKPYRKFFETIVKNSFEQERVALHAEDGERILEVMNRIVQPLRKLAEKTPLPTYQGGMANRPAPYVEELDLPVLKGI